MILRRLAPSDARALFRTVGDPDVMRYWVPGPDSDVDQTLRRISAIDDHWRVHGFGDWAVIDGGGEVIGFAGLHHITDMAEVNVGYALEHAMWGRGIGGEVCRLVLDLGFRRFGLPEIVAVIDPRNAASLRLAASCGLTVRERLLWNGHDRIVYAITRDEWAAHGRGAAHGLTMGKLGSAP